MYELPWSQACENNKVPILQVLGRVFSGLGSVLEIGSGTGQHAVWFAEQMPWLCWQPTDTAEALPTLRLRCAEFTGSNLKPPLALDVCQRPWPVDGTDAVFTANTLHIMPWSAVEAMFATLALTPQTLLAIYGPFNYGGRYTSESNARFDDWLAARAGHSAIRDFEAVEQLAMAAGFTLQADHEMPANNRLLLWQRANGDGA